MKLRIRGNSLRLRLLQQEMNQLASTGRVSETISFGPAPEENLVYTLKTSEAVDSLQAQLEGNKISISIASPIVQEMVSTDRVGIEMEQPLGGGNALHILVEKDFKCLSPRQEDVDAFPHPQEETGHV